MLNKRISLLGVALLPVSPLWSQVGALSCQTTAVPAIVRAEGVAERFGDIVISCSGPAGRELTGNLAVILNTTLTNRIVSSSGVLDAVLTVNDQAANVPAMQGANNQVNWSGLRVATNSSGRVDLRISNLRGDVSFGGTPSVPQFGQVTTTGPVTANLAFNPGGLINFTQTVFTIGTPQRGLYATTLNNVVPSQVGSALPEEITFETLIAKGTAFASTRLTEGAVSSFEPTQAQTTQGTRMVLRFSGYPTDARLFVPAAIAGSNAAVPTRAGDFGGAPNGGAYLPGSHTLLLARMLFTDANGAGGTPAANAITGLTYFNQMTEVTMSNGSGTAIYEVFDSDPSKRESAQIPVFIGVPRSPTARSVLSQVQVSFAPASTTATTSTIAPVPRFIQANAPSDCSIFGDCSSYIPKLGAPPVNTEFRLTRGVGVEQRNIALSNDGGGLMPWSATVEYKRGSGWISLDRTSAWEPVLVRMNVSALTEMQPGIYEATLTIDAGQAGIARYPIRLEVVEGSTSPPPPTGGNRPVISSIVHGATFAGGPVARGSYVTLRGSSFGTADVIVTFDGKPARVVYASSDQINVLVPSDLSGNTTQVVVTVAGTASTVFNVNVSNANPGIFTPGIVNQDGSINSAANPANTGSFVQIYATGLLAPDGSGMVEAKLHDQVYTTLPYAGPAPGIQGLQQVNLKVQEGWPTMTTEVLLCTNAGGQRQCSAPVKIHIRQAQ